MNAVCLPACLLVTRSPASRLRGYLPLGPFLVEDAAAALFATDGVAPPQRELEAAVAADVVHRGALEVERAGQGGPAGARGVALARGDLVGFARHGAWCGRYVSLGRWWACMDID